MRQNNKFDQHIVKLPLNGIQINKPESQMLNVKQQKKSSRRLQKLMKYCLIKINVLDMISLDLIDQNQRVRLHIMLDLICMTLCADLLQSLEAVLGTMVNIQNSLILKMMKMIHHKSRLISIIQKMVEIFKHVLN